MEQSKSIMHGKQADQSINQLGNHMSGPHQSPFIFAWTNFINSITWNYEIWFWFYFKTFQNRRDYEDCMPKKMTANFIEERIILKPKKKAKDEKIWRF